MKYPIFLMLSAMVAALGLSSCVEPPETKPAGPTSDTSAIPWNQPIPGQGQGQFGMMNQNQYRR